MAVNRCSRVNYLADRTGSLRPTLHCKAVFQDSTASRQAVRGAAQAVGESQPVLLGFGTGVATCIPPVGLSSRDESCKPPFNELDLSKARSLIACLVEQCVKLLSPKG
jgi:hypothetical protein